MKWAEDVLFTLSPALQLTHFLPTQNKQDSGVAISHPPAGLGVCVCVRRHCPSPCAPIGSHHLCHPVSSGPALTRFFLHTYNAGELSAGVYGSGLERMSSSHPSNHNKTRTVKPVWHWYDQRWRQNWRNVLYLMSKSMDQWNSLCHYSYFSRLFSYYGDVKQITYVSHPGRQCKSVMLWKWESSVRSVLCQSDSQAT